MKTDLQIAKEAKPLPISEIAKTLGLSENQWEPYGRHMAKITDIPKPKKSGKLILVTAISPTKYGEGKTTVSVGLSDGLRRIGHNAVLCLREPSLGPVFGVKGGAAGGGFAQVIPMEDLNLHFTGDIHAITAANNLLSAAIDNHLQHGNALGIDHRRISWRRAIDMNDRALRNAIVSIGGTANGVPREEGFNITAASEIMAILCLSSDISDCKKRLANIVIGCTRQGAPITCADLNADGAMAALLKDAIKPNLVQTLEHTPTLIHGGPFANIAHGCNSLIATKTALGLGDLCVTEAGFGADLGAEKFIDIKCRTGGLSPSACVIVSTVRAYKHHGGSDNLKKHIENVTEVYGLPAVVAINRFASDTDGEIAEIRRVCDTLGVPSAIYEGFLKGGAGAEDLAREVVSLLPKEAPQLKTVYPLEASLTEKIELVAKKVYGAGKAELSSQALKEEARLASLGFDMLPVCIAKTQYSFSDDQTKLGSPKGFTLHISELRLSAGAGFIVALAGDIMTMPGLPKSPALERITIDNNENIDGLF